MRRRARATTATQARRSCSMPPPWRGARARSPAMQGGSLAKCHLAPIGARCSEARSRAEPNRGHDVIVLRAARFQLTGKKARLQQVIHGFGMRITLALVRAAAHIHPVTGAVAVIGPRAAVPAGTRAAIRGTMACIGAKVLARVLVQALGCA